MKWIVLILAVLLSLVALVFVAICLSIWHDYPGSGLEGEIRGYFDAFLIIGIVFAVPAIALWLGYYFSFRKNTDQPIPKP